MIRHPRDVYTITDSNNFLISQAYRYTKILSYNWFIEGFGLIVLYPRKLHLIRHAKQIVLFKEYCLRRLIFHRDFFCKINNICFLAEQSAEQ